MSELVSKPARKLIKSRDFATTPTGGVGPRLTALIVASALFMEQLDATVLSTALPDMARSFNADPLHMNVALTSYLLSLAVFIPISGKVADRFGSRTVFRGAIALFTIGSILCGRAESLSFLVGARVIQGIGGAMMVPVGRLVLLRSVAKNELVSAMAWLLIPATIGPVLGPPLGGLITTYLSWRWIFDINVPVGVVGIILVTLFIDDVREQAPGPFDVTGFLLSGIGLASLMFGLEFASRGVGSLGVTATLLGVGVVAGGAYWWHARGLAAPILDIRLLRVKTFALSVYAGTLSRIAIGALPFLLPMMLQLGFGLTAAASGMITFASAAGSLAMKATAQPCLRAWGFRNIMIWVGLVGTLGLGVCAAFRPSWPLWTIYAVLLTGGFFQSLQFISYNTIAYADIARERMSAAISLYTTIQQMALSLGIAASAGALASSMAWHGHGAATLGDYSMAFLAVTAVSLAAPVVSLWLDPRAGAELTGHK